MSDPFLYQKDPEKSRKRGSMYIKNCKLCLNRLWQSMRYFKSIKVIKRVYRTLFTTLNAEGSTCQYNKCTKCSVSAISHKVFPRTRLYNSCTYSATHFSVARNCDIFLLLQIIIRDCLAGVCYSCFVHFLKNLRKGSMNLSEYCKPLVSASFSFKCIKCRK